MWIFAAQSGACAAVGPADELEALDEVPPARVVIGVGVGVEAALEVRHHEHPAGEDQAGTRGSRRRSRGASSSTVAAGTPAIAPSHSGSRTSRPQRIATPSVRQRCIVRSSHGRSRSDALEVHRVAELVQHRLGPALAGHVVAEHRARRRRGRRRCRTRAATLPVAGVRSLRASDAAHVEAHAVERAHRERLEVGVARGTGRGRRRSRSGASWKNGSS